MKRLNSNKLVILLLAGLILLTISLSAQDMDRSQKRQRPPDTDQLVNELTTVLSLSETQANKISDIYEIHFSKLKAKHEKNAKVDHKAINEPMEGRKKELNDKIRSVLNKEQKNLFKEWNQQHLPESERPMKTKK